MLNTEKIINDFNTLYGRDIDPYDADVIAHFVDLDMLKITDKMVLDYLKDAQDAFAADDNLSVIFDADKIREHANAKKAKKSKKATIKAKAVETPAVDTANPFGMFEQMISGVVASQSAPIVTDLVEGALNDWMAENQKKITKPIEYVNVVNGKKFDGITHECFEDVCAYVSGNEPVLLVGAAGTGKNHLCKQVADFMGLDFYFANAVTQEHKLTGFIDANGTYHETQFYKAFKNGGLFMFDELDASDPDVLVTFNAALANGYFDFPTGRVDAHENFRVVAAANTTGNGASYEYVGRNQLDAATLNRFGIIEIGYSEQIENAMTDDTDLLTFVRTFRNACAEYGVTHIASYRDISRCSKFKNALGVKKALKTGLIRNLETDDINMLVKTFESKADEWSTAFCELARGC